MNTPLLVAIKERVRLNSPTSDKKTYHLALDLKGHSFDYEVGDCIGIYPTNHPEIVERILRAIGAKGGESVVMRDQKEVSLLTFLTHHANCIKGSKKLARLLEIESSEESEVIDLLEKSQKKIAPQELVDHLLPLLPRLYSIASSKKAVGDELHLTIALTQYEKEGQLRYGCCSRYLCEVAQVAMPTLPIYLQKAKDFCLTEESFSKPLIMIGPGTGVAPFRGFLQERMMRKDACPKNWLFFGERRSATDFYYRDFWEQLVAENKLRLDVAFSRDQPQKVYVQHLMEQNSALLWQWLQEGAYLFVCGDAERMAKDVESTLQNIISTEGKLSPEESRNFIKFLRKEKRYLRDVY